MIYEYLSTQKSQNLKMKFFRRFQRATGHSKETIPLNPYKEKFPVERTISSNEQRKTMLCHFKAEMQVIVQRYNECQSLKNKGHDPRRSFGGEDGDWASLENRMYVVQNVIGLDIRNIESLRDQGLRTAIKGLELPGPVTLREDGRVERKSGVTGYLRWFYPSMRDLFPFAALLQMRTKFGNCVVIGLRTGTYAFRESALDFFGKPDQVIQFAAPKFRTVSDGDGEPSYVHCTTLKHPSTYPLKIIKFLELLRKPLQAQIDKKIRLLKKSRNLTLDDRSELNRLSRIRDDLFLYYSNGKISSLGEYADEGDIPRDFRRWMSALGYPTDFSHIRNSALANGLLFSGGNRRIMTLLGDQTDDRTSKYYFNRQEIKNAFDGFFIEYFQVSLALAKAGIFSKEELRTIFIDYGFSREEADSLMSKETITHWGNNCAAPTAPPGPFAVGTKPGEVCVAQNCIDGCPNAVWFPSALEIVRRKHEFLVAKRNAANFVVSSAGFLNQHIAHCEYIIQTLSDKA